MANLIADQNSTAVTQPNSSIFVLLLAIPCLMTAAYGGVDAWSIVLLSFLISATALIWIAKAWRENALRFNREYLLLPMIALIAVAIVQLLPFSNAVISRDVLSVPITNSLSLDPYSTRIFLVRLVGYSIFFAAALTFIDKPLKVRQAVITIVIFGALMAFVGILQKLASPDAIYGLRTPPQAIPFGPFVNQHHFAALMNLTSGVALALLLARSTTRDKKMLIGIAAVLMAIALILTSSRGALVSYLAVFGFTSFAEFRFRENRSAASGNRSRLPILIGSFTLIVIAASSVVFLGGADLLLRGIGLQFGQSDISSGRLHFWSVAWQIFISNPIIGAGFDAFGVAFTQFDTRNGMFRVEQAHNDYLQMLADGGIAAFACVTAFIVLFAKKSWSVISTSTDGFRRSAAIGAFAGCLGIMVHSFFDFPLRTPANAFFFLLLAAIAVVPIKAASEP